MASALLPRDKRRPADRPALGTAGDGTHPGRRAPATPHSALDAALIARLPIWCYRWRLGWLLGNRFLLLTHTGRRSGRPRQVVLEVVRRDRASGVCIVASGWGEASDGYRNLRTTPAVTVHLERRKFTAQAECLAPAEDEQVLFARIS